MPQLGWKYFNSRPSARGDPPAQPHQNGQNISIHAPPRGATRMILTGTPIQNISIHAPPRGATPPPCLVARSSAIFQFTPLREGRRRVDDDFAPLCVFQFTPLREGRLAGGADSVRHLRFQFTPLREGRPRPAESACQATHFNSRPSARGDQFLAKLAGSHHISIHAPPRGATGWRRGSSDRRSISIHAPPRGATWASAGCGRSGDFNSRPSARGDGSARCPTSRE